MTILSHTLGFPRIGLHRELKKALEEYWKGDISQKKLLNIGYHLRVRHWEQQKNSGIDLLPVGDFAWYDHVLTTSLMLGNIPKRHRKDSNINLETMFRISRGYTENAQGIPASEMTKWFNTNYHYIVPEFEKNQDFKFSWKQLIDEIDEAKKLNFNVKPVLLGPITYLWLGKKQKNNFSRLDLLEKILPIYKKILSELIKRNIEWVQIDEPILVLELSKKWLNVFHPTYSFLASNIKILLTTYFNGISHNLHIINNLSVHGLHIDLVHGNDQLNLIHDQIPKEWVLSLGIINGRNIWRSDLYSAFKIINLLKEKRNNLWISASCSLLHVPIDLSCEKKIDKKILHWFSFAIQKCKELSLLTFSLNQNNPIPLKNISQLIHKKSHSDLIHNFSVSQRMLNANINRKKRDHYNIRIQAQKKHLKLPILPTTTIGSLPQTNDLRILRMYLKKNRITLEEYQNKIYQFIKKAIIEQENLDLDVLVHGEFERNDMVEYFGENLNGFVFTQHGWVQSYGSRCVKPPVIFGDISRSKPITIPWIKFAQSLTKKPIKGMLTGPISILLWSFPREDISYEIIAKQIALALSDEIKDLEKEGISIIQIDEPAFREGLPLDKRKWKEYFSWSIDSFHLAIEKVLNTTQIHTHMCYSEFNDIIENIAALDADVITIETSRSNMELLKSFETFAYPNEIGPGVYDIHSTNIPKTKSIEELLIKAKKYIPIEKLWVNPDCGLKTRKWKEVRLALKNMVDAAKNLRIKYK